MCWTTGRSAGWRRIDSAGPPQNPICAGSAPRRPALTSTIEDISERVAALAIQGPTSAALLSAAAEADLDGLKYFRVMSGRIAGKPVEISEPDTQATSAMKCGWGARTLARCGTRWSAAGPAYRLRPTGPAGARCRAHRSGAALDRRRFLQRTQGVDGLASVFAVRNGPRSARGPRQGCVHRMARARRRAPSRSGPPNRRPRRRLARCRGALRGRRASTARDRDGVACRRCRCSRAVVRLGG